MKRLTLFLIALFTVITLSADPGRVIDYDSFIYEAMDTLFILEGRAGLASSKPWTESIVRNELSKLDKNSLTGLSLKLYQQIEDEINSTKAGLGGYAKVAPEIYIHTNKEFDSPLFWDYSFEERSPFLDGGFDISIGGFFFKSGITLGYGKITNKDTFKSITDGIGAVVPEGEGIRVLESSYIYSKLFVFNLPSINMLYLETPGNTNIGFANDYLSLGFYRDRLSWGRSKIGNFIFDDHINMMEYLSFKAYNKDLGFDYVLYFPEVDYSNANQSDYKGKNKVMMAHMFSFNILKSLAVNVSENVMYSFTTPQSGYFNPAYIFHNLNNSDNVNAIAHLELEYMPVRNLRLYTQFALDQATAPTEANNQAPAYGLLLGAEYVQPLETSYLSFYAEGALTTPFLYRRNHVDFIVFERYAINNPYGKFPYFTYLGFPYGGDAVAINAGVEYVNLNGFSSKLDALVVLHGGTDMTTVHSSKGTNTEPPDIRLPILSEGGFTSFKVSLDNRYRVDFSFGSSESFINLALVGLKDKLDFQVSIGTSFEI